MTYYFSKRTTAVRLLTALSLSITVGGSFAGCAGVFADGGAPSQSAKTISSGEGFTDAGADSRESVEESAYAGRTNRIEPLLNTHKSLSEHLAERIWAKAEDYEASAYCLRGRTASGQFTRPGVLAADPRVLPIGTVVHLEAGPYTGIYTVLDTGGKVKGKKVDIYCATYAEAIRFGRRSVRVRVIAPAKSTEGISKRAGVQSQ